MRNTPSRVLPAVFCSSLPAKRHFRTYNYAARVSYDLAKREWTLTTRGLDFEDAALVFDGLTAEVEDKRKD